MRTRWSQAGGKKTVSGTVSRLANNPSRLAWKGWAGAARLCTQNTSGRPIWNGRSSRRGCPSARRPHGLPRLLVVLLLLDVLAGFGQVLLEFLPLFFREGTVRLH